MAKPGRPRNLHTKEALSLRLDALLRFGIEVAMGTNGGSITGFIERAVEDALRKISVQARTGRKLALLAAICEVWNPEEAVRFVKLATDFPNLLTRNQLRLWQLMLRHRDKWTKPGHTLLIIHPPTEHENTFEEDVPPDNFDINKLKRVWPKFQAIVEGGAQESILGE